MLHEKKSCVEQCNEIVKLSSNFLVFVRFRHWEPLANKGCYFTAMSGLFVALSYIREPKCDAERMIPLQTAADGGEIAALMS